MSYISQKVASRAIRSLTAQHESWKADRIARSFPPEGKMISVINFNGDKFTFTELHSPAFAVAAAFVQDEHMLGNVFWTTHAFQIFGHQPEKLKKFVGIALARNGVTRGLRTNMFIRDGGFLADQDPTRALRDATQYIRGLAA